jgi:uncharacterized protein (DUF2236 family)
MNRMRIALAAVVTGALVSLAGSAAASERPPTLQSTPKPVLGARVVLTGLFFKQNLRATLYLEAGKTRTRLATANVPRGGQLTLRLRLPKTAPKNAHLLVCQSNCSWRVQLALAH